MSDGVERESAQRSPCPPTIRPSAQRLAQCHVAVIGCGGLGSNAAAMLARAGVLELTLIDFDVVEESNLNRQMFFRDQLGMPKTEALAATLRRIRDDLTLHVLQQRVTEHDLVGARTATPTW